MGTEPGDVATLMAHLDLAATISTFLTHPAWKFVSAQEEIPSNAEIFANTLTEVSLALGLDKDQVGAQQPGTAPLQLFALQGASCTVLSTSGAVGLGAQQTQLPSKRRG